MSITTRDLALVTAALLTFPVAVNVTALNASEEGRDRDRLLHMRGDSRTEGPSARE